jgi:hypothetical protein
MTCKFCDHSCQKTGRQKNWAQKFYCGICKKYQQSVYRNKAWEKDTKPLICKLVCESVSYPHLPYSGLKACHVPISGNYMG